jgi:hypothetical protein
VRPHQLLDGCELHKFADIAQLAEREFSKLNVVGSRPTVRSISGVPLQHHVAQSRERCVGCVDELDPASTQRENSVWLHAARSRQGTAEMEVAPLAQLDRALAYEAGEWEFESLAGRQFFSV